MGDVGSEDDGGGRTVPPATTVTVPPRRRRSSTGNGRAATGRSGSARRSSARGHGRGRRTSPRARAAVYAFATLAAVLAVLADGHPTSLDVVDALLRAGFAAGVTLAASRSQRWTWLVLAGAGAAFCAPGWWQGVAGAGLAVAFAAAFLERSRVLGAAAAALAVQGLLRMELADPHGLSALVATVAVLPVLASAYQVSPRRVRRRIHRVVGAAGAFGVVALATASVAALLARGALDRAVDDARSGLRAVEDGEAATAEAALGDAAASFDDGAGLVTAWWVAPARTVPVLSQHLHALGEVATVGGDMARQAAETAATADPQDLRYEDGQLDLALLESARDPVVATAAALAEADRRIEEVRSPWLLTPLTTEIDRFHDEIVDVLPQAELAAAAVEEAPGLFGADGARRYLVLFTTPAESRGLGGFVGNWAELTAADGRVELTDSGRISDLNEVPGRDERSIDGPADYLARYGRFRPAYWLQDTTLSPDFPSVAQVWHQLWPQLRGTELDGVLAVDPLALAALLEFTGPIDVPGWPERLGPDNAASVLLREQYVTFDDDRAAREDLLDEAGRRAFEELTRGSLPAPRQVSEVLAPVAEEGRLLFWSAHPSEQRLMERLGVDGAFTRPDGGDFFSLVTQNSAQNKIDVFLERSVSYRSTYDPVSGQVTATATITLTNNAPASGLPDAVIGSNDQGLAPGTNRVWLSFYTPLGLTEARLDGTRTGVEYQREFGTPGDPDDPTDDVPGYAVYGGFHSIPPGATITLEYDLRGRVEPGRYRLGIGAQPLVNPDRVLVEVGLEGDARFLPDSRASVDPAGQRARWLLPRLAGDSSLELEVEAP